MNENRTVSKSDTNLTRVRSADVPAGLIQMRTAHGYESRIGRRCSNILEMLDAGTAKPTDIARQARDLAELTG